MRRQTYDYLSSRRASPPLDRYEVTLLADRGTCEWITCPRLLAESETDTVWTRDFLKSCVQCPNQHTTCTRSHIILLKVKVTGYGQVWVQRKDGNAVGRTTSILDQRQFVFQLSALFSLLISLWIGRSFPICFNLSLESTPFNLIPIFSDIFPCPPGRHTPLCHPNLGLTGGIVSRTPHSRYCVLAITVGDPPRYILVSPLNYPMKVVWNGNALSPLGCSGCDGEEDVRMYVP